MSMAQDRWRSSMVRCLPIGLQSTVGAAILLSLAMHAVVFAVWAEPGARLVTEPEIDFERSQSSVVVRLHSEPMRVAHAIDPRAELLTTQPMVAAQPRQRGATTAPSQRSLQDPARGNRSGLLPVERPVLDDFFAGDASDVPHPILAETRGGVTVQHLSAEHVALVSVPPLEPLADPQATQSARPDYAYNPQPLYPLLLREEGVGGVVWLRVWVDSEGRPQEIKLAQGSGYRLLDDAAYCAVRKWRFIPAQKAGRKVASWVEFPIRFTLKG